MRRHLVEVVLVFAVLSCGAYAQTANSPITYDAVAKLSPLETARLLGVTDGDFSARTIYPAVFLGSGLGSVILFEIPHALLPGICEVGVVHVDFKREQASPVPLPRGDTPYEIAKEDRHTLFMVVGELNGSEVWSDADKQNAQALCRQAKIGPDMYSRNGADFVFTANSAEMAQSGARALDAVVTAAAAEAPLAFKISCDGAPQFCDNPRGELARLSIHRFESIDTGDCKAIDQICYHVTGGDYRADWSADIAVARHTGTTRDKIIDVRFREILNPLE